MVCRIKENAELICKMSFKFPMLNIPVLNQAGNFKLPVWWMKFGVTLFVFTKRTVRIWVKWLCFLKLFWLWTALHLIYNTPVPSSFIHPTCSACQLDALQSGPQLCLGVSTSLTEVYCVPSPKFTGEHDWSCWQSFPSNIPYPPHSYREAATIYKLNPIHSNMQLCFSFKFNATKSEEGGRNKLAAQLLHAGSTTRNVVNGII